MLSDWNFWCTIVTSIAAVLALCLTAHQMVLSNKQQLFERRLKTYMLASGLIALCKENYMWLSCKREDTPDFANDLIFVYFTNNSYMESQAEAIKHPLEQPFHKDFLRKREELRSTAMEIQLIFKGKSALLYSNFVSAYEAALLAMYQYQIIINHMNEENEKHPMTIEELQKIVPEKQHRAELYAALDKLKEAYDAVVQNKTEKQMKKQLMLI